MKAIVCCLRTFTFSSLRRSESLKRPSRAALAVPGNLSHLHRACSPKIDGLFREEDYPSVEKLRGKFGLKLEGAANPERHDSRVPLTEEELARVAREIDESVRQSLDRGMRDLWVRLTELVTHIVERLNEPESRFHASLVTNVFDLVELLPRLNVNHDEELNRFAA